MSIVGRGVKSASDPHFFNVDGYRILVGWELRIPWDEIEDLKYILHLITPSDRLQRSGSTLSLP